MKMDLNLRIEIDRDGELDWNNPLSRYKICIDDGKMQQHSKVTLEESCYYSNFDDMWEIAKRKIEDYIDSHLFNASSITEILTMSDGSNLNSLEITDAYDQLAMKNEELESELEYTKDLLSNGENNG